MDDRLERIISETDLWRYDTVIDQVHRLDPHLESSYEGTGGIPTTTIAFAIMIGGPIKIGHDYVEDAYLVRSIMPFIEAFGCEIGELAGRPVRVYYQGTHIIGMEPL